MPMVSHSIPSPTRPVLSTAINLSLKTNHSTFHHPRPPTILAKVSPATYAALQTPRMKDSRSSGVSLKTRSNRSSRHCTCLSLPVSCLSFLVFPFPPSDDIISYSPVNVRHPKLPSFQPLVRGLCHKTTPSPTLRMRLCCERNNGAIYILFPLTSPAT